MNQRKIILDKSDHYCYNIFMFNKRMNVAKELERIKKKKACASSTRVAGKPNSNLAQNE